MAIYTSWDRSINRDLFKRMLRKLYDNTDRDHPQEWREVYNDLKTKDDFERDMRIAGLEPASLVPEGEEIGMQDPTYGSTKEYTQSAYGTGFRITHRMKLTNKWDLMEKWTRSLAEMQRYAKDVEAAKLFNDPTGATYTFKGFDTLDLAENTHTGLASGTGDNYDNLLGQALATSSIESAYQYFEELVDDMGHVMPVKPDKLVFHPRLIITAREIFRSDLKAHEFSNTKNVYDELTLFPYHFLTSSTMWYMLAKKNSKYDINMFTLMDPDMDVKDAPDNTRDTVVTSLQYFTHGFGDPRCLYCGNT